MDPKSQKSGLQLFGFRKSDGFPPEANTTSKNSKLPRLGASGVIQSNCFARGAKRNFTRRDNLLRAT